MGKKNPDLCERPHCRERWTLLLEITYPPQFFGGRKAKGRLCTAHGEEYLGPTETVEYSEEGHAFHFPADPYSYWNDDRRISLRRRSALAIEELEELGCPLPLEGMNQGEHAEVKPPLEIYKQYRNIGGYPANVFITFADEYGTELLAFRRGIPAEHFHPLPNDYPAILEEIARFELSEMGIKCPENTIRSVKVWYFPEAGAKGNLVLKTGE